MPEELQRTTILVYRCDVCKKGQVLPTGEMYDGRLFVHKCEKCGQGLNLEKRYPVVLLPKSLTPNMPRVQSWPRLPSAVARTVSH